MMKQEKMRFIIIFLTILAGLVVAGRTSSLPENVRKLTIIVPVYLPEEHCNSVRNHLSHIGNSLTEYAPMMSELVVLSNCDYNAYEFINLFKEFDKMKVISLGSSEAIDNTIFYLNRWKYICEWLSNNDNNNGILVMDPHVYITNQINYTIIEPMKAMISQGVFLFRSSSAVCEFNNHISFITNNKHDISASIAHDQACSMMGDMNCKNEISGVMTNRDFPEDCSLVTKSLCVFQMIKTIQEQKKWAVIFTDHYIRDAMIPFEKIIYLFENAQISKSKIMNVHSPLNLPSINENICFVQVPKSGSESLCALLGLNKNHFYAHDRNLTNCWSFTIVRNPWDRMRSWFSFCRSGFRSYDVIPNPKPACIAARNNAGSRDDFNSWVKLVLNKHFTDPFVTLTPRIFESVVASASVSVFSSVSEFILTKDKTDFSVDRVVLFDEIAQFEQDIAKARGLTINKIIVKNASNRPKTDYTYSDEVDALIREKFAFEIETYSFQDPVVV